MHSKFDLNMMKLEWICFSLISLQINYGLNTILLKRIDFFKPTTSSQPEEFDPATSVTLKMVLAQDEADAGSVTFVYSKIIIV